MSKLFETEKLLEKCGVVGVFLNEEPTNANASVLAFSCLQALQHRGHEGAGVATLKADNFFTCKGLGKVNTIFDSKKLQQLQGNIALGHVLFSSNLAKESELEPYVSTFSLGNFALCHNGALTNASELKKSLLETGESFTTDSEAELIAKLITKKAKYSVEKAISEGLQLLKGSFSLCIATNKMLVGARDSYGRRPLCLGKIKNGWVIASETSAFDAIGAEYVRSVNPGEIIIINEDGVLSFEFGEVHEKQTCAFEYIYFARPDSQIDDIFVQESRLRMGAALAKETGVSADVVIGVPNSGIGSAMGYATASGIPYALGIVKNAMGEQKTATNILNDSVAENTENIFVKLNVVKSDVKGRRVIIVDDSLPSLNTLKNLVEILNKAGAEEVHYRVASPKLKSLCKYGIDIPSEKLDVFEQFDDESLAKEIGATSISFLSVEGMINAISDINKDSKGFCKNCFL